jgi:hypothetical protein
MNCLRIGYPVQDSAGNDKLYNFAPMAPGGFWERMAQDYPRLQIF